VAGGLVGEQEAGAAIKEAGRAKGEATEKKKEASGYIHWLGGAGDTSPPGMELGLYP
jgi:hypothetical protein